MDDGVAGEVQQQVLAAGLRLLERPAGELAGAGVDRRAGARRVGLLDLLADERRLKAHRDAVDRVALRH